ncbi:hypothetical protein [Hyalangium versicolor]|uniref:hypothetical protein n=1 Tax=Hyalangium versicolor TaxID=2861190 RepID=UPI001CCA5268|nr:hypothetical protein [Hyalangium versicolor]
MKALIWLAVLIGAVVATVPWISATMDEAGLREDVVAAPNLSRHGTSLKAGTIAGYLMQVARQRGINLQPENLRIEVSAAEAGALGGIQVGGQQVAQVQKVLIHVDYRHPLYLGLSKHMEFTLHTSGIGNGGASTFPGPEQEEEVQPPSEAPTPEEVPSPE